MKPPPIHYTATSDGKRIAYTVAGEGAPLVQVGVVFTHQQLWMESSPGQEGRDAFAPDFRFVSYDARGTGLSTRGLAPEHSAADWQLDLDSVVDAVGPERVILMAWAWGNHIAIRYALRHPERVRALVLNTVAMTPEANGGRAFWLETPRQNWDFFLHSLQPAGLDHDIEEEFVDILRQSMTQDDLVLASAALFAAGSIEAELASLRVPTLVLFPRHFRMFSADESARVAALIPGCRFEVMDGDNGVYMTGRQRVAAIKDFLASLDEVRGTTVHLSARELDVLRLVAAGQSNQQIAQALVISTSTVAKHVASIFVKTESANRTEAAIFAHRNGVL